MKRLAGLILVMGFFAVFTTQATTDSSNNEEQVTSDSKMPLKEATRGQVKQTKDDIDQVITNKKLRAELGSKSKWSASLDMAYDGGSVEKPIDEMRPDIYETTYSPKDVRLYGRVKGRYRVSPKDSISFGIGVEAIKPFHGAFNDVDKSHNYTDVYDPFVNYTRAYNFRGLQNVTSIEAVLPTTKNSTKMGKLGYVSLSQTLIGTAFNNKLSVGVAVEGYQYLWNTNDDKTFRDYTNYLVNSRGQSPEDVSKDFPNSSVMASQQIESEAAVYPFLEWTFNDTFNLRTVFGYFSYFKTREDNYSSFQKQDTYQSIGLGVSVARNFFLYPNLQFSPENARWDRTNVGISATINLF